jgi:tetratricopeptide (TPR) repeat protein
MGYSIPAENLFEKAATIWAETPARDTMILGATFYNLGVLYKDSDKPMQSQFAYRKAQEFLEPRMDPNDMILANILTDLGDIYRERDVHDSAVLMYEDALPRLEASQPKHSLPVARLLNNMGISLSNLGSYAEAEQAYNKALLSLERVLGPDDLEVGHCIENLTSLYHRQARYKESLRLSVLAQEIFEKRIGKNSLEAVEMLYLRGIAHQRRKELDKAETMLVEARERLRTMPSQGTGRLVRGVYTSLEEVYSAAGKDDLASQVRRDLEARQAGTEE